MHPPRIALVCAVVALLVALSTVAPAGAVLSWESRIRIAAESDFRPAGPHAICADPVDPHVVYHVIGTAHAYGYKGPAISTFNSSWAHPRGATHVNATRLLAPHALVSQTRMEEMFGCAVSDDGGFVAFVGALHAVTYRIVTPGVLEFYAVLARSAAAQAAYALGLAADGGATAAASAASEYPAQFPHWSAVALHRSGWPASFLGNSGDLVLTGTYYDDPTTYSGEANGGGIRYIYVAGADGIYRLHMGSSGVSTVRSLGRARVAVMGPLREAIVTANLASSLAGYGTASTDYNPMQITLRRRREPSATSAYNWTISEVAVTNTVVTDRVSRKNLTSVIGIVGKSPHTARVYMHEHINAASFGDFKVCTLRYDESLLDAKVVEACQTAASGMRCQSATAARVVPIPGARLDAMWCSTRVLYIFNDVYNAYTSVDASATFSDASTVAWSSSDAARGIFVAADSTGATVVGIASEAPTAYKAIQPAGMRVRVGSKVKVITNNLAQENSTLEDLHAYIVDPGEEYATAAEKAVVLETITPAQNTTAPAISITFREIGHLSGLAAYTLTRSSNVAGEWSSDGLAVLASGSTPNLRPGFVEVSLAYTPTTQPFGELQTIKGTMFVEPFDRQHIRTLSTHVSVVNGTLSSITGTDAETVYVVALVRGAAGSAHATAGVPAAVIVYEAGAYYARRINAATGTWFDEDFAPDAMVIPSSTAVVGHLTNAVAFHTYTGASYGAVVSGKTYVATLNATTVCRGTVSLTLPGAGLENLQCGAHGIEVTGLGRAFNATQVHNAWLLNDGSRLAVHTCLYYSSTDSNNICHIRTFDFPPFGQLPPTNMNHTVIWTGTAGKSADTTLTLTETARSATGARRYILTQSNYYSGFTTTTGVPYHAAVSASGAVGSWVRVVPLPTEEPYTSLTVGPTPGPLTFLKYVVCDPTARTATHCVGVNDAGVHPFFFPGGLAADVSTTPNDARLGQSILTGCDVGTYWGVRMDPRLSWATTGEKGHQLGVVCAIDSSVRSILMFQFNTGASETADAGFRMHRAERYFAARDAFASFSQFWGPIAFDPNGNGFYVMDNTAYGSGVGGGASLLRAKFDAVTNTPRIGPVAEEANGFLILDTWMPPAAGATEDSDGNAPLAEEGCSSSKVTFERTEDYYDSDGHKVGAATNEFIFQLTHAATKRFATSSVDAPNRIRINLRTPNGTAINVGLDADLRGEDWTYTYPANLYFPTRNQTLDGWFDVRVTCVDPHYNPEVSSTAVRMLLSSNCASYGLDPGKQCQSCHTHLTPSGTLCLGCTNGKFGPDCTLSVDDCAKQMCGDGTTSYGDCVQPIATTDAKGDAISSGVTCSCDDGYYGAGCDMDATECRETRCGDRGDCETPQTGCTCDDAFEGATCGSCAQWFAGTSCDECASPLHDIDGGCETCLNGGVHPNCDTCANTVVSGVSVPVFFERGNCSGYDPKTGTVVLRTKEVCNREVCGPGVCLVGGGCDCDKWHVLDERYVSNDATFMADVNNKACVYSEKMKTWYTVGITVMSVVAVVAFAAFLGSTVWGYSLWMRLKTFGFRPLKP